MDILEEVPKQIFLIASEINVCQEDELIVSYLYFFHCLVGLVFDFLGAAASAVFIAIWNIASVIIEHFLLINIVKTFPALSIKEIGVSEQSNNDTSR